MSLAAADDQRETGIDVRSLSEELSDWDQQVYLNLISTDLTSEQRLRIAHPARVYPKQEAVLAVHWHPEAVPLDLIRARLDATFPNRQIELIIPTQHNTLVRYDDFIGAEVDCFSPEFNRKVQLLVHFEASRLEGADVFKAMLVHTFRYRSRQLFEFMDTIIDPAFEDRIQRAAAKTGADADLVAFVRAHTIRLRKLVAANESITPPEAIKNKLLAHYLDALREHYDDRLVNHAQMYLKAVKKIVKANFSLEYFYATQDVISEVRSLGGGIVVPHPEQFWPILLADYDVDGYEVWNPQSREYTEFLISVVHRQNQTPHYASRPILIFMGDDCHMGEKTRDPRLQDPAKAGREIGVQSAWDDLSIRKRLIVANATRRSLIEAYRERLVS